ncbi:C40 family peptidase [Ascidiimonas sp. W6]|uniref:C40 family peptidase n=1 Tax=Ascidiimonas meishanensis TaxID=3128903 RepID=UPI0030ED294D
MKRILPLLVLLTVIIGCKSSKKTTSVKPVSITVKAPDEDENTSDSNTVNNTVENESALANEIVRTALSYSGTRYKYGGITSKGMDCSGLLFVAFKQHEVPIQRTSSMMASQGVKIKIRDVQKGDLLFFTTGKNKRRINHVGLVVAVKNNDVKFIHSTTSRGVLISSINEGYWNYAFKEARRIL